jgi:hypothetical protein
MIHGYIKNYIHTFIEANRAAGWNFDWDRSESCQFTKYKHNQYYDWHCDGWDKPYENLTLMNMVKLENYL